MVRKVFLVLLTCSLILVAACGQGANTSGGAEAGESRNENPEQDQVVQLRWAMFANTELEKEQWQYLADKVTEKYPNIKITLETDTFNNYWDKLQTQLASKTAADILYLQSLRTGTFASRGAFTPLEEYINKTPEFKVDDFATTIMQGLSWQDQQVALPYDYGPLILYYNKDLFDKYNVEYPTENMTWDEFLEKAKATTKEGESYGFVFGNSIDQVVPWIWSNGGDYMSEDEKTSTIHEPAAVEAIQFLSDLIHKHKVAVPFNDPGNPNWTREQFYSGKVAMYIDGPWNFGNTRSKVKFNWDVTTIPSGKAGSVTWVAGAGFGIYSESKHKEEAWKAITVILSEEGQKYLASAGRAFPARKSALETFSKANPIPENVNIVAEAAESGRFYRTTTNWQEATKMINRELDYVWMNNIPAEEAAQKIKPQFDSLLQAHQKTIGGGK